MRNNDNDTMSNFKKIQLLVEMTGRPLAKCIETLKQCDYNIADAAKQLNLNAKDISEKMKKQDSNKCDKIFVMSDESDKFILIIRLSASNFNILDSKICKERIIDRIRQLVATDWDSGTAAADLEKEFYKMTSETVRVTWLSVFDKSKTETFYYLHHNKTIASFITIEKNDSLDMSTEMKAGNDLQLSLSELIDTILLNMVGHKESDFKSLLKKSHTFKYPIKGSISEMVNSLTSNSNIKILQSLVLSDANKQ